MALLKNAILVALLLLFSLKFTKTQEEYWEANTEVTEALEEWYPPSKEEASWEYPTEETRVEETRLEETCVEEAPEETVPTEAWEETHVEESHAEETRNEEMPTEESPIEEIIVEEEEGSAGECPRFIEETEVNGHWMTFHPCCVESEAVCSRSYQPVCLEELRCEVDHCRRHYETVTNVCLACKGEGNLMYSLGECPWEKNAF